MKLQKIIILVFLAIFSCQKKGSSSDESAPDAQQDDPDIDPHACLTSNCDLDPALKMAFSTTLQIGEGASCNDYRDFNYFHTGTEIRFLWRAKCEGNSTHKVYTVALNASNLNIIGNDAQSEINLGEINIKSLQVVKFPSNIYAIAYVNGNDLIKFKIYNSAMIEQASGSIPDASVSQIAMAINGSQFAIARRTNSNKLSMFLYSSVGQAISGEVVLSTSYSYYPHRIEVIDGNYFLETVNGSTIRDSFKVSATGQFSCKNTTSSTYSNRFSFKNKYYFFAHLIYTGSDDYTLPLRTESLDTLTTEAPILSFISPDDNRWKPVNLSQLNSYYVLNTRLFEEDLLHITLDRFIPNQAKYTPMLSPLAFGYSGSPITTYAVKLLEYNNKDKLFVAYATDADGIEVKVSDTAVPNQ